MVGAPGSLVTIAHDLKGKTSETVILGGNLEIAGTASLRAGDLTVNGSIDAVGDVSLRARGQADGSLTVNGPIVAGGDVDLGFRGGGTTLTNAGDRVGIGSYAPITAGGDVTIRVRNAGAEVGVTLCDDITAGGEIQLRNRWGDYPLCAQSELLAGASLVIDAGGSVAINATLTAEDDIDIESVANLEVGGTLSAETVRARTVASDMLVTGALASGTGSVELESGGDITITGSVDSGAAALVIGGGNVTMSSTSTFNAVGESTFDVGGSGSFLGHLIGAGVSIYSNTTDQPVSGDLTWGSSADWTVSGTVSIDAGGDLTIDGSVDSGDMLLIGGGNLTIGGTATVSVYDSLFGVGETNADIWGDVSSDTGTITIDAGIDLTVDGDVDAGGDIVFNVGGQGLVLGLLGAGVSIYSNTTDSGGSTTWAADTSAPNGTINIASDGPIVLDGEFDWNDAYGDFPAAQTFAGGIIEFDGPVVYHHHAAGSDVVVLNIYDGDRP